MTVCFLLFHEIGASQRKKQKPAMDLRASGQAPQSESVNPRRQRSELVGKKIPVPETVLIYLITLWAACWCVLVGTSRNWLSLLTA